VYDYPGTFADALGPHAARFGLRRGDGLALLRWLLDLVGDPDTPRWMDEARDHTARASSGLRHEGKVAIGAGARPAP
jgi:GH18 family chitinase